MKRKLKDYEKQYCLILPGIPQPGLAKLNTLLAIDFLYVFLQDMFAELLDGTNKAAVDPDSIHARGKEVLGTLRLALPASVDDWKKGNAKCQAYLRLCNQKVSEELSYSFFSGTHGTPITQVRILFTKFLIKDFAVEIRTADSLFKDSPEVTYSSVEKNRGGTRQVPIPGAEEGELSARDKELVMTTAAVTQAANNDDPSVLADHNPQLVGQVVEQLGVDLMGTPVLADFMEREMDEAVVAPGGPG